MQDSKEKERKANQSKALTRT